MVRSLWLLVFLLMNGVMSIAKAPGDESQTVYCIGNHDATGSCWKAGSENEEKLGCVITSWPIVECQSIPENEKKQESYECLALQNTGIVNQIALSCQPQMSNAPDEGTDSLMQEIPQFTPKPGSTNNPDAADQASVLEREQTTPNAFRPGIDSTTYGVEQPQDFKKAF